MEARMHVRTYAFAGWVQAAPLKSLSNQRTEHIVCRQKEPPLAHQFGKVNLLATSPSVAGSSDNEKLVLEQNLYIYVIIHERWGNAPKQEIDFALPQLAKFQRRRLRRDYTHDYIRIAPRQSVNDRRRNERERLGTPDAYFSHVGIRQKLDIADPLLEFVEHHVSAFEQCFGIYRGRHAMRATVQEAYAEGHLQIGNRVRYGGLRHCKMRGRLGHAAPLHYGRKNMEVAQPEPAADAALPFHRGASHKFRRWG